MKCACTRPLRFARAYATLHVYVVHGYVEMHAMPPKQTVVYYLQYGSQGNKQGQCTYCTVLYSTGIDRFEHFRAKLNRTVDHLLSFAVHFRAQSVRCICSANNGGSLPSRGRGAMQDLIYHLPQNDPRCFSPLNRTNH
jgi:hypothetical protein